MKSIQLTSPESNQFQVSVMGPMEGAPRATGVAPMSGSPGLFVSSPPDPEVTEKKPRRKFTVKYKLQVLAQADTCTKPGQLGALLRSEGLYSSNLTIWRRQREEGLLDALSPKKRGRKKKHKNPLADKVGQLERDNRRLQQKLKQAELIIEAQKKCQTSWTSLRICKSATRANDYRYRTSQLPRQQKALSVPRATFYRYQSRKLRVTAAKGRPAPPLALEPTERQRVIDILHSDRFLDDTPYQIYATLLDEGHYHCSIRTMYRFLSSEHGGVKERRRHVQRPNYVKPELLATEPNQVWSWDITKLKGPVKWTYYYLYVILDIFSRCVVGWMIAQREFGALAKRLIEDTCEKQHIEPDQLIIHSDRGSSMKSKPVALLLSDLGVTKSHSRPHVSNDNPYSEAQFKTLKYCSQFPCRFGSIQDARSFCQQFFIWYNKEHRHSGIGLMTPEQVHYGLARKLYNNRCQVLRKAYEKTPQRFKGNVPKPHALPKAAWINKPDSETLESNLLTEVSHFH